MIFVIICKFVLLVNMKKYDHKKIERKWQKFWEDNKFYRAEDGSPKEKYYCLIEFPYPSGDGLHVGHVRSYTALDIIARKKRMQGFNVLYPIGWDAFGLPAENYAIKTGKHPTIITKENVKVFTKQIKSLGISFDWSREINTTDSVYYKWTQWIFLQLYKHGLAYKKKMPINWCPSCKIGLANEEVIDGKCERCGAETEKRELEQWMLKITAYADRLIEDLETVEYLEKIKTQQINWIGRSEGAEVDFQVKNFKDNIRVFTTRPDTLFGATFIVLSPEHELVNEITTKEQEAAVLKYQEEARKKSDLERTELQKEKTGVFTGAYAINPVNKKEIPIWIADYVMMSYGTGAIMAVPAHDERDWAFAKKYKLAITLVLMPFIRAQEKDLPRVDKKTVKRNNVIVVLKHWAEEKYYCLDWKKFGWTSFVVGGVEDGEDFETAAIREMKEESGYQNIRSIKRLGGQIATEFFARHKDVNRETIIEGYYIELQDGERILPAEEDVQYHDGLWVDKDKVNTFINLENHAWYFDILMKGEQVYSGDGININSDFLDGLKTADAKKKISAWLEKEGLGKKSTNYHLRDWVFSRQHYWGEPIPMVYCVECGWQPIDEKELPLKLPMVKKYEPTDTGESPLASIEKWVNTICPKCKGRARRETDTMPNWAGSSWYFLRYVDPENNEKLADLEKLKYWTPVDLYNGGMEHTTLHLLYSRFWHKFLYDIAAVPTPEPYQKRVSHGMILASDNQKMSKSRGNVLNPDQIVEEYGADALRLYEMFMGPYDQAVAWDTNGLRGIKKFLDRVWAAENREDDKGVTALLHKTIKKVTEDIDKMHFNTAVAAMMILLNKIQEAGCSKQTFEKFLIMLSPFAPHLAEEKWSALGNEAGISLQKWPQFDEALVIDEQIQIPVQINGKVRDKLLVSADIVEEELKKLALASDKVQKHLAERQVKKIIYVTGRLISIVV